MELTDCSFSKCDECLRALGGNKSAIGSSFEAFYCNGVAGVIEAATLIRNKDTTSGFVYIKTDNNVRFGDLDSNGIDGFNTAIDFSALRSEQFISADANGTNWKYVSYAEMSSYIYSNKDNDLRNLIKDKFAVNPKYNALVVEVNN